MRTPPVILTDKYYDALGRLSDVCRHGNCGRLESWYDYNVRSWICLLYTSKPDGGGSGSGGSGDGGGEAPDPAA